MPESTLSLQYKDLAGEVGLFLGYGRGADFGEPTWTTAQKNAIDSCVRSGLRQFYYPPPVEGQESPFDWSFLKPTASIAFAQGASTVALSDDFGGFEGQITVSGTPNQMCWPVPLVGEGIVRQRHAEFPSATGRPMMAALQPIKGTSISAGQRNQLYLWPLADQSYTLQFQFYILPDFLNEALPYTYGGMAHSETILESCLSIAEQRLDDSSTVHSMKFQERLRASIGLDRRCKPQKLGYNRDLSDCQDWLDRGRWRNPVKVYGVQY